MFERYNEKARRTIFFARHAASRFGGPAIECEHLLIALIREEPPMFQLLQGLDVSALQEDLEQTCELRGKGQEKHPESEDLPLSTDAQRVLADAATEAEELKDRYIGPEHLLLGLMNQSSGAARLFTGHEGPKNQVRAQIVAMLAEAARRAGGTQSAPTHTHGCLEFVDAASDRRLALFDIDEVAYVPRVGEVVQVSDGDDTPWRVVEVWSDLRGYKRQAKHNEEFVAVRVRLERRRPGK